MDDRIQIHNDNTSPTTSYGGVLPRNATESVMQSRTNGSPISDGTRKPDKAPLMTGMREFTVFIILHLLHFPWILGLV
ncbi:hypothetical protein WUBG_14801, partial [Wuchereria bancrofti]